jgi:hypothetical protein
LQYELQQHTKSVYQNENNLASMKEHYSYGQQMDIRTSPPNSNCLEDEKNPPEEKSTNKEEESKGSHEI